MFHRTMCPTGSSLAILFVLMLLHWELLRLGVLVDPEGRIWFGRSDIARGCASRDGLSCDGTFPRAVSGSLRPTPGTAVEYPEGV
jgi:hypothetical protein